MTCPILQTERLTLRLPSAEDFEAWAAFHAEENTMRFPGGVQARGAAWRSLCTMVGAWSARGIAHEAAVAAMDYAVDGLGWDHVIHTSDPENGGSIKLAQRLGAVNEGTVSLPAPLESVRVDAWGRSADQWRARRGTRAQ